MTAASETGPADPADETPLTGTVVSDPSGGEPTVTDQHALEQELRAMTGVVAVRTTASAVQVALDPTIDAAASTQAVIAVVRRLAPQCATVEIAHRDPRS